MATKRAKQQTAEAIDKKGKDFLTEGEMKRLINSIVWPPLSAAR